LRGILGVDGIPVDILFREEAVMLVHDVPESLEVAAGIVVIFLFLDAGGKEEEREEESERYKCPAPDDNAENFFYLSHGRIFWIWKRCT
jgi:hypothetical protein